MLRERISAGAAALLAAGVAWGAQAPGAGTSAAALGVFAVATVKPMYAPGAERSAHQACVNLEFTVTAQGTADDISVWSLYPEDSQDFARASEAALRKWRFHPRSVGGKPVATDDVMQGFVFVMQVGGDAGVRRQITGTHLEANNRNVEAVARRSLDWVCDQPPLHGVTIFAPNAATAGADEAVALAPGDLPAGGPPGRVHLRFCIDDRGRVIDTTIRGSSPRGRYDRAALSALEKTDFTARKLDNGAGVLTCGLNAVAKFTGAMTGEVGTLGHMTFEVLSGRSPEPKLVAQKPVRISLHIPAGTPLPKVAKVEVRMCIEKDGTPSGASVVRADPPQYFDQAALETVAGWRFAHRDRRMCDVYQWVRFPLGG